MNRDADGGVYMADEMSAQSQMSLFGDVPATEDQSAPSAQSPRARHAELNRILNHAAYAYYALDNPEMTDAEFDRQLQELLALEKAHPELAGPESYTQRVGGYVSEQFEPVAHAARMYSMDDAMDLVELDEWLARFDLTRWAGKRIEALSKGMAQKVQFISTVIHSPKLLIFDEPFSGFDPVNTELLKKEMLRLHREGATIIFSTHNMASVEEVCEEIALINHSQVVLSGKVPEIRRRFSKKLYRVNIANTMAPESADGIYEINHIEPAPEGGCVADIKLTPEASLHDAISCLNERYALTAFHELLPSMNEIFIETVSNQTGTAQ